MVRFATASMALLILNVFSTCDGFAPISHVSLQKNANVKAGAPKSKVKVGYAGVTSMEQHAVSLPSFSGSLPSVNISLDSAALTQYLLETLISNGVPAFFWIAVIAFAAKSFKGAKNASDGPNGGLFGRTAITEVYDDLYGSGNQQKPKFAFGGPKNNTPKNLGIPTSQYLRITKLNDKYQSYQYSLTAATQSKAKAAAQLRAQAFDSALQRSIDSSITEITPAQKSDMLTEEKAFLKQGSELLNSLIGLQRQLTDLVIKEEMRSMDVQVGEIDAYTTKDGERIVDATIVEEDEKKDEKATEEKKPKKKSKSKKKEISKLVKEIEKQNTEILNVEMEFIRAVIEIMGADRANAIRASLIGNIEGGSGVAGGLIQSLQNRPLATVLSAIGYSDEENGRNLYVADFPGDVTASQVETLREEVTAMIRTAKPGDEVLLILNSGGGTVTGYGLAASQLQRFKQHGMKLTICVEQVAASGGYMMACVADKVVASPFAVLGSIGVISDLPNAYERLKKEGIEFQTVTAGKYKRTLTPTKKVTQEDIDKTKQDLEDIWFLFKSFVAENRPSLDIEEVATGETWFGKDALARGLCDELNTVDDVLCKYVDDGFDVYSVKYDPQVSTGGPLGDLLPSTSGEDSGGIVQGMTKWLVRNIVPTLKQELSNELNSMNPIKGNSVQDRYMMKDPNNTSDRIKIEL